MHNKTLPANIAAAAAIAISLASPLANATDFQHEAALQIQKFATGDYDSTMAAVGYVYHFQSVSQQQGPWNAAEFLNPTSNLSVITSRTSGDSSDTLEYDSSGNAWQLAGEWLLVPGQTSLRAAIARSRSELEFDAMPVEVEGLTNVWSLGIHHYLSQTTRLSLEYGLTRNKLDMEASGAYSYMTETRHDNIKTASMSLKHLYLLDSGKAFGAQASLARNHSSDDDNETLWSVAASYFPTQRLELTAGHEHSNNAETGYTNEVDISWFASSQLVLNTSFSKQSDDDNSRTWMLGIAYQY